MSSESESDDDYVPGEPEKLSEEESADDETEQQYDNEVEQKNKKRKIAEKSTKKKTKKSKTIEPEVEKEEEIPQDSEEQKKKDDDLWAMFLDGTDTKPKAKETAQPSQATVVKKPEVKETPSSSKASDDAKEKERRIFDFAGETIVVENDVIKERIKKGEGPAPVPDFPSRGSAKAGLSGVLGHLNKKNKLSTLEKSKLDWTTFKKAEGLEEEIQSFNKGKQGYLERRDFLERADIRQYEIERDLRLKKRSNR